VLLLKNIKEIEAFLKLIRLFNDIFREVEAFDYNCEASIKFTRLFEDIFTEMKA
jgi:hypothetical protein